MKKNTSSSSLLSNIPEWHWPIPFVNKGFLNAYLDKKIGVNQELTEDERWSFINGLHLSISLDLEAKQTVLYVFKTLSEYQIDELNRVWIEEKCRFDELKKEHPDDIIRLTYKGLLEWGMLFNEEHGDFIFIEKFFSDENINDATNIELLLKILTSKRRYLSLFFLTKKAVYESGNLSNSPNIYNYYLFSFMSCKFSKEIDSNFFINVDKEISNFKIDDDEKKFLKICAIDYASRVYGFSFFDDNDTYSSIKNSEKRSKKLKYFSSKLISNYHFSKGDRYKHIKNILKSWLEKYETKANIESLEKMFEDSSIVRKQLYNDILSLIIAINLSNYEIFDKLTHNLYDLIYRKILNEIKLNPESYINIALLLEILLDKKDYSSDERILKYINYTDNKAVKFIYSINQCFNSANYFIDKSKEVLLSYQHYDEMIRFISIISIYLSKKSMDTDLNIFIINSLEKAIKTQGIGLDNEFDIFRKLITNTERRYLFKKESDILNCYLYT